MTSNFKLKVAVIIENDNKIYLQKEKFVSKDEHLWNIVTGSYEATDSGIIETAKRECLEETGLRVEPTGIVHITMIKKPDSLRIYVFMTAKTLSTDFRLPDREEQIRLNESIIEQGWFSKDDINKLEFCSDIVKETLLNYLKDPQIYPFDLINYQDEEIKFL